MFTALHPHALGSRSCCLLSYQDFLTLWKDADPDLPTLKAAKAEFAKLAR